MSALTAVMQDFKKTALHMACNEGNAEMVRCLLSLGADPDLAQPVRLLSIVRHVMFHQLHERLLCDAQDTKETPLHYSRNGKVTLLLLRHGANKRKKNRVRHLPHKWTAKIYLVTPHREVATHLDEVDSIL